MKTDCLEIINAEGVVVARLQASHPDSGGAKLIFYHNGDQLAEVSTNYGVPFLSFGRKNNGPSVSIGFDATPQPSLAINDSQNKLILHLTLENQEVFRLRSNAKIIHDAL